MLLALAFVAASCGGSPSPEDMMQETLSLWGEMTDILASVKDEASAKAAAGKLEALAGQMKELAEEGEKMEKELGLSPEEKAELENKFKPEFEKTMGRFMQEMMRIGMNQELNKHLETTMEKMGEIFGPMR
jgi:hypothetical protein